MTTELAVKNTFEAILAELPKPYYQDSAAVIYNADCRELLPLIPAEGIDLTLTDPPYNVGRASKGAGYCDGDKRSDPDYKDWCADWFRLLPRGKVFFTCGSVNLGMWHEIEPPKWVIAWFKPNQCSFSRIGGFNTWEPVLCYGEGIKVAQDAFQSVIKTHGGIEDKHECPKDPKGWAKLITIISKPGDIILDPFLGSGTTAVCGKKLERRVIGFEISEAYCEISAKRLLQSVMSLGLAS